MSEIKLLGIAILKVSIIPLFMIFSGWCLLNDYTWIPFSILGAIFFLMCVCMVYEPMAFENELKEANKAMSKPEQNKFRKRI